MHRFAHISDVHLGSQREKFMRDLEVEKFRLAIDMCIEEKVDFVVIAGDLFHNNVPPMQILNEAIATLTKLTKRGIPIYMVYGSHDFSHDTVGAVDILETAGIIRNVSASQERVFTSDPGTGALLAGISGRKIGLEKAEFENLAREEMQSATGFRIFVFHSAISEFKPPDLADMESIEISYFPRGFSYYAGGHVHRRGEYDFPGYDKIVFPGSLYLGWQSEDISRIFKGERRGFYVVDFDSEVRNVRFVPLPEFAGIQIEVNLQGFNSAEASRELQDRILQARFSQKAVLVRVYGTLSGGKTSDINFGEIRKICLQKGATHFMLDRFGLRTEEMVRFTAAGNTVQEIEQNVLRENLGNFKTNLEDISGERGIKLATALLQIFRAEKLEDEKENSYSLRIVEESLKTLGLNQGGEK
ncbi:MAG: DNA repair exonuclease [Candidatus Thermoplasmatota archaeon]|nr:DNA repair exonuclease [Candidatus Thermoplasmatota archaeon]